MSVGLGEARRRYGPPQAGMIRSGAPLRSVVAVFGVGLLLLAALGIVHILQGQAGLSPETVVEALVAPDGSTAHNIVRYIRLPRVAIAILAGAALGIAGVLFQAVTRNPLASPGILGVNAGAALALTVTTIFFPDLHARSPVLVAFGGGLVAAGLVYLIAAGVRATPVRLALAGVAVSLTLSAATAVLQLFYEYETAGLFLWGAGHLDQNDWSSAIYAWPRLLGAGLLALLLARALDVLLLGDEVATALGQQVQRTRLFGAVLGVFLAALAVSVVGPIGFVGLVVPHLVRLLGIRQHRFLLPGAALWGALLLAAADVAARFFATNTSILPAGGITALVGAPFLIWLARRSARSERGGPRGDPPARVGGGRTLAFPVALGGAFCLLLIVLAAGLALGEVFLSPAQVVETLRGQGPALATRIVFELRLPRLLVATLAGASLAVSGLLLQGVVRNPLAGPEIVGVSSGAGLGALLVLIVLPGLPIEAVPLGAFGGACAAFGLAYVAARDDGVAPARLALVGIAVSALCSAGINLIVVSAELRVAQALVWLAGSTYARGWEELWRLVAWPLVLLPVAWLLARWLDLLALGDDLPQALGLRVEQARALLLALAVALAGAAVSIVGTLGFVGLIAPHAARVLVGGQHRRLVLLAALLGAVLVAGADTVGRTVLAPKEIPSGLVTAMIGTPYFVWLLWRSRAKGTL